MITSSEGEDSGLILPINRIKNKYHVITIALSVSLSAVMFGYSLKEITSIPIQVISDNYHIQIDQNLLQGLLIAIMPFGGLFGSLAAKLLIKSITRRQGMNLALPFLILSICLVQFSTAATLFIGRFLEGTCVGYYVSIAPIYLKQISPKEIKSITGTFFSCGKIAGVLLVIVLQLIIGQEYWRILLSIPALLGIVQFLLLGFIGSDTPYEWIIRKEKTIARRIISKIYVQAEIENVLQQIENDIRLQNNKTSSFRSFQGSLEKKKQTAFFTATNACISRHFTGGNSLIITAGVIVSAYDKTLGKWTPLIINSIQIVALLAYILYFSHLFGKRRLLISSMGLLTLINTLLVVALVVGNQIFILASIMLAMAVYGGMLLSVVWSYPSEILPASESLVPNIMHWLALTLSSLAPSLVISLMPNNQVYPCFIFFAVYCLFGFFYFIKFAVQSNGATYHEIIGKFKEW